MFAKLLILFTLVPLIELGLLIELGTYFGVLYTVVLVALTGAVGVFLARNQGFLLIQKIKALLSAGKMPTDDLIEALLILIGGILLLTPGLLTDITGFLLIIPVSRRFVRKIVKNKFRDYIFNQEAGFTINVEDISDVDFEDVQDEDL